MSAPILAMTERTIIRQERRLVTAIPGPISQRLLARRNAAVARGVGMALPVFIKQAGGGILVDVDGNSLIDFASGFAVASVGNSAPAVVDAVSEQLNRFTHTCFSVTPYEGYVEVCEALNAITPGGAEKRSILLNSGAEAVENAVKIARAYTQRDAIVVLDHAFHGRTNLTMAMTATSTPYKVGFGPFAPEVHRVPMAYPFRWPTGPQRCAEEAAAAAIDVISRQVGVKRTAAIVFEPIQGQGGYIVPAPGFFSRLADFCRSHGILVVADEIQTGFCRTGDWFASEHEGIEPDLIITAKGIAGGLPLAAVTGRAEVMDAAAPGGLGGTYAGNPLSCAAALGAIHTMKEQDLVTAARRIGTTLSGRLRALAERHEVIGEVRGRGAMVAIELVQPGTKKPNPETTSAIAKACHREGLVLLTVGSYANVLGFLPPLVIGERLLDEGITIVENSFAANA